MPELAIMDNLTRSMRYLSDRQHAIAGNIANSETPGYKARDVEKPDFSAMIEGQSSNFSTPRITRPHVDLTSAMTLMGAQPLRASGSIAYKNISETKPDGNNVTLEDQLLDIGSIQADFATMTSISRNLDGLMTKALGSAR